ncbi:MAG: aminoacetone oxidase family FAD-binding enzyme [Clostridia bacterium]|nr:aminoacetone oxidase family FAD-binding enzyme [Clostridia bacterium]
MRKEQCAVKGDGCRKTPRSNRAGYVMRTIIIGGGPAGMAAAIAASACGDQVTLLERLDRVGKKLMATGNGRCNLMNTGAPVYPGGEELARAVLSRCGVREQTAFWHWLGLRLREEGEGRVYPVSGQAASVLDVLRFAMERQRVEARTGVTVTGLKRKGSGWLVETSVGALEAERVIVTGGGKAQPKLGSDGSCYRLLTGLGHRLIPPRPALTQIETETALIRGLSGQRARCTVSLKRGGQTLHIERGEALFTDYGLSGVCAMQCARAARAGDVLSLDFTEALRMTKETVLAELWRRSRQWRDMPRERLLSGLVSARIGTGLLRAADVSLSGTIAGLTEQELRRVSSRIADFPLRVTGLKGFDSCQVTAGGIDTADFSPDTMASLKAPGLHAAGEVMDVDGDCGGFNLMFAFGSGILAGLNGRRAPWEDME